MYNGRTDCRRARNFPCDLNQPVFVRYTSLAHPYCCSIDVQYNIYYNDFIIIIIITVMKAYNALVRVYTILFSVPQKRRNY